MQKMLQYNYNGIRNGPRDYSTNNRKHYRMNNAVLWGVMPCGSCDNRRFGGICRLHESAS
jgi:hypothetical protein